MSRCVCFGKQRDLTSRFDVDQDALRRSYDRLLQGRATCGFRSLGWLSDYFI